MVVRVINKLTHLPQLSHMLHDFGSQGVDFDIVINSASQEKR